jgi:archaetidylinositol phosphate synthase
MTTHATGLKGPVTGSHTREHRSLLAAAEKRTLVWMAERLPRWINSDHLTALGALAMAGTAVAFGAASIAEWALLLVPVFLALNWFGDSLDGTVARVRNQQRPRYGYYLDHVVDVANATMLFTGLAVSGLASPWIASALLVAYLLLAAESFLATHSLGVFKISFAGFGPTELRILLSIGALVALVKPEVNPFGLGMFKLFDVGGFVGTIGMCGAFLINAVRNATALYRAEPLGKAAIALLLVLCASRSGEAATLKPETEQAWRAYVTATEARIERELASPGGFLVQDFTPSSQSDRAQVLTGDVIVAEMATGDGRGRDIPVPDGLIHHWRASIFVPGVTRDQLLARLQNPSEHGPRQEDVLALRVLERRPDALTLFIRMTRTKIVTVTYNTTHDVTYRRHGQTAASSRSVATKIAEVDGSSSLTERELPPGEDRGFLWRLNSYWRYQQVEGGVIVELESLTLSRTVPMGLGRIVEPIVKRIARDSIGRTLENLRRSQAPVALARSH